MPEVDLALLHRRQETYLTEHYLTTHVTAVSVALGAAGISAGSLLTSASNSVGFQIILVVLWLVSLLATATAYAGTMIGSIMLPAHLPGIRDLLLPLLLALSEFLLFAVLAYQITGLPRSYVLLGWWFAFLLFGLAVFGSVRRACFLIGKGLYGADAAYARERYLDRMAGDRRGTAVILTIGVLGFSFQLCYGRLHTRLLTALTQNQVNFVIAVPVLALLVFALRGHHVTARLLKAALARTPIRRRPKLPAASSFPLGHRPWPRKRSG